MIRIPQVPTFRSVPLMCGSKISNLQYQKQNLQSNSIQTMHTLEWLLATVLTSLIEIQKESCRWNYMGYLSRAYLDSHQYDKALSWAKKALRLRPDQPETHFRLAVCLAHLDDFSKAQIALEECDRLCPRFIAMKVSWQPYSNPDRSKHYLAGLRRLSLID